MKDEPETIGVIHNEIQDFLVPSTHPARASCLERASGHKDVLYTRWLLTSETRAEILTLRILESGGGGAEDGPEEGEYDEREVERQVRFAVGPARHGGAASAELWQERPMI